MDVVRAGGSARGGASASERAGSGRQAAGGGALRRAARAHNGFAPPTPYPFPLLVSLRRTGPRWGSGRGLSGGSGPGSLCLRRFCPSPPPRPLPYRCGGKLGWGLHGGGVEGVGWRDPSLVRCVPAGAGQRVMWLGSYFMQRIWCVGITGLARLASQI